MDVLVGLVLEYLPWLHLTFWLLRDVCCAGKDSISQSVRVGGTSSIYNTGLLAVPERNAGWCAQKVYQTMPYLPLN